MIHVSAHAGRNPGDRLPLANGQRSGDYSHPFDCSALASAPPANTSESRVSRWRDLSNALVEMLEVMASRLQRPNGGLEGFPCDSHRTISR
jgi:hypothetical protein